ncbi:uncharacterized protein LOC133305072 isoform X2 [Gastrolobium bilobum]|nr:uncharacterized protein LOC133305072 isoform X2 [Gastrolobium bilobum]XP_061361186.1 uncharacterized protein LOC133305072 isoform X2 [Gastrolobium bilobum]
MDKANNSPQRANCHVCECILELRTKVEVTNIDCFYFLEKAAHKIGQICAPCIFLVAALEALVGVVSDFDLLAIDSISGGPQSDTNVFPLPLTVLGKMNQG